MDSKEKQNTEQEIRFGKTIQEQFFTIKPMTNLLFLFYNSCRTSGFKRKQATQLTVEYAKSLFGGANNGK